MHSLTTRRIAIFSVTALVLALPHRSGATSFLSDLSFTPASNAPLAGLLSLTTPIDTRISVLVSDGTDVWERDFYDYATVHSVPLLGFKPDCTNEILVTAYDKYRNAYTADQLLTFVTAPLPANFPHSVVLKSDPSRMEPGYVLGLIQRSQSTANAFIIIVDTSGEVVWYCPSPQGGDNDVRQLDNGDLFIQQTPPQNDFLEINLLGETVRTWYPPAGYPINPHKGVMTDHGTILYFSDVSRVVSNFPSAVNPPPNTNYTLVTQTIDDSPVVEISATNSMLLNTWSPLDLLDPTRVTYLTYEFSTVYGVDNEHANAIVDDTNDNSIIASLRDQNTVFKFSRSGQLRWILGPHAGWSTNFDPYLLTPVGTPFEWNYGQHAPELSPEGTLLVYDDGNDRASPFDPPVADQDNYSRAVEYLIDETNMEVSQIWDSTPADEDRLFTPYLGRVQWLPQTRNLLVTYGAVTYINGVHPSALLARSDYDPDHRVHA